MIASSAREVHGWMGRGFFRCRDPVRARAAMLVGTIQRGRHSGDNTLNPIQSVPPLFAA
jgi:hypothetical protein